MTTSDYLMLAIYRQHEQEMIRDLERRRAMAERRAKVPEVEPGQGILGALGLRFNRLHSAVRHQTARG